MIHLGDRLKKAAELVEQGARVIDVGTDHAKLAVYLLQSGRAAAVCASDIRTGPLKAAEATVRQHGFSDQIRLVLCDGLSGFSERDGDTVVIAGMGGEMIAQIMENADWLKAGRHALILQAMTSYEELRRFLFENGYATEEERVAKERGKLYAVLRVRNAGRPIPYQPIDCLVGRSICLDPLGGAYIREWIQKLQKQKKGLEAAQLREEDRIRQIAALIEAAQQRWEEWNHANRI